MTIQTKSKHGFTIIEVVVVLAIAGLIFMMVFLALPALQRSQRDTQRRDDMSRFLSQVNQYQANNRGKVPTAAGEHQCANNVSTLLPITASTTSMIPSVAADDTPATPAATTDTSDWCTFMDSYLKNASDDFSDPGGSGYWIKDEGSLTSDTAALSASTMDYYIHVYHGANCDETEATVKKATSGSSRKIAILYKLEGAGTYCGES